jgi:hypothetical protein
MSCPFSVTDRKAPHWLPLLWVLHGCELHLVACVLDAEAVYAIETSSHQVSLDRWGRLPLGEALGGGKVVVALHVDRFHETS